MFVAAKEKVLSAWTVAIISIPAFAFLGYSLSFADFLQLGFDALVLIPRLRSHGHAARLASAKAPLSAGYAWLIIGDVSRVGEGAEYFWGM